MATYQLDIVTPAGILFSGSVQSVRAPGIEGSLGVLAGHAPLMTALEIGPIVVHHDNGDQEFIATSGGFMEVRRDRVTILADTAERAADVDVTRAEAAISRARADLSGGGAVNYSDANAALARATNRLKVAQMAGQSGR
jgi:F-type H+-transporting ATPase subunit epsilon